MRLFTCGCLVLWAAVAMAFNPAPVQPSAAEQALVLALAQADADSMRLRLAKQILEDHPEDVVAGRAAQDVLLKLLGDPVAYFKSRAEGSSSIAAHYLYARAANDTVITAREADWILRRDGQNFWGLTLHALAEWDKAKPDTAIVRARLLRAISADPSRPEGYLNLGWLYMDEERWTEAREALEAGAVADPAHKSLRDARLTAYAELRDADAYFALVSGVFPDRPLVADLPRADGGRLTTAELRGEPVVLEYWAFT